MQLDLTLTYDLAEGWLAPHLAGLRAGKAVAGRCRECARISFPPERICSCGPGIPEPCTLSGSALIMFRTDGSDGAAALVRFDGADTLCLARLEGYEDLATANRGRLCAATSGRPALVLAPETDT